MFKFYFKYINIPHYEDLVAEMQPHILKLVNDNNLSGFHHINMDDFFKKCPKVNEYFTSKNIKLECIAIIIAEPNTNLGIHKDWQDDNNALALNMEIINCRKNYTAMFFCENEKEAMKILTTPKGSKFWRIFDTSKCYLISEFNLTNPVLFDTLKIHQVRNTTNERRISISFRFKNKDAEIFDILLEDKELIK